MKNFINFNIVGVPLSVTVLFEGTFQETMLVRNRRIRPRLCLVNFAIKKTFAWRQVAQESTR